MSDIVLSTEKRDLHVKAKDIRLSGRIPAIVYGHNTSPVMISVEYQPFRKAFRDAGESTVISLEIDGKSIPTLVHDVQYEPILDTFSHIDFYAIQENETVKAHIPLIFTGISPAVKTLAGVLTTTLDTLEIRCLPKYLVHDITVDISSIEDFHTVITVGDLEIANNKNIEILTDISTTIVSVTPPRAVSADAETPAPTAEVKEPKASK